MTCLPLPPSPPPRHGRLSLRPDPLKPPPASVPRRCPSCWGGGAPRVLPAATQQGSEPALCRALPGATHVASSPGWRAVPGALPGGPGRGLQGGAGSSLPSVAQWAWRTEQVTFSTRPVCPPGHVRGPAWPALDVLGSTQGGAGAGPARLCPRDPAPALPRRHSCRPRGWGSHVPKRPPHLRMLWSPCSRVTDTSTLLAFDAAISHRVDAALGCLRQLSRVASGQVRATSKRLDTP